MLRSLAFRKIVLIWLAWWVILFGYQELVQARYDVRRPDTAVFWTRTETAKNSQNNKPYLLDPFLNAHVSWDSEFYVGVAEGGYDNPKMRMIPGPGPDGQISISYAFFPLYPLLMRLLGYPLGLLGLSSIATVTLAGLVIALLGTLGAMVALYDLAVDWLGEAGGLRAAFYLLVFPTGFFLAQVYTEGLFVGLTFGSLALARRGRWWWAGVLAALAVWTRAVGVALVIPLGLAAFEAARNAEGGRWLNRKTVAAGAAALLPLLSLGAWWLSPIRARFQFIEDNYFGRGFLLVGKSLEAWGDAWNQMLTSGDSQRAVYYALEFALVLVGLLACLALLRRMPLVAWFSLAVFAISFFSGAAQSMNRYVLGLPALFLGLSSLGKHEAFDRSWTLASVVLMGMLAALFSFDMWVG